MLRGEVAAMSVNHEEIAMPSMSGRKNINWRVPEGCVAKILIKEVGDIERLSCETLYDRVCGLYPLVSEVVLGRREELVDFFQRTQARVLTANKMHQRYDKMTRNSNEQPDNNKLMKPYVANVRRAYWAIKMAEMNRETG